MAHLKWVLATELHDKDQSELYENAYILLTQILADPD